MTGTKAYTAWHAMMRRCYEPKHQAFKNYGARGITVCERWHDFATFYSDMGPRPAGMTLDREHNDGPYAPWNCRWSPWRDQQRNRRSNRLLTVGGRTATLTEWAEESGLQVGTLWRRLKQGWPVERAVQTPRLGNGGARRKGASLVGMAA